MNILVKFPIRSRREKFFTTLTKYRGKAHDLNRIHFLISMDADDPEMNRPDVRKRLDKLGCEYYYGQSKTKIQACNADIDRTNYNWDILVLASDDMIPIVQNWDGIIRDAMEDNYPDLSGVLHFYDGHQKDGINTLSIIGREWYHRFGYVYNPAYQTMWCDTEFSEVSRLLGKEKIFSDTIIEHQHPYSGACSMDELYKRNNDDSADRQLFNRRKAHNFYLPTIQIIQPGRYGDILICLPIAKFYSDLGNLVYWKCPKEYHSMFDYTPYVKPVEHQMQVDRVIDLSFGFGGLPEKWWQLNKTNFDSFVTVKYFLAGIPSEARQYLKWNRDFKKENDLFDLVVSGRKDYTLVQEETHTGKFLNVRNSNKIVLQPIDGYTIFDWYRVIKHAKEIHCIDSILSNFIEGVPDFRKINKTIYLHSRETLPYLRATYRNGWIIDRSPMQEHPIVEIETKADTVIVIPVYKRPKELHRTLQSVMACINENTYLILADDGSRDHEVSRICNQFMFSIKDRGIYLNQPNVGVAKNMRRALDVCDRFKYIITLDSDFIVQPDFIDRLKSLLVDNSIVTGFNAPNHRPIEIRPGFAYKNTIGGGNLCFTWKTYTDVIRPALINDMWDFTMSHSMIQRGGKLICSTPSVCQHIGMTSTLGHTRADVALDFQMQTV